MKKKHHAVVCLFIWNFWGA